VPFLIVTRWLLARSPRQQADELGARACCESDVPQSTRDAADAQQQKNIVALPSPRAHRRVCVDVSLTARWRTDVTAPDRSSIPAFGH
jgi:hypothetical protein